MNEINLEHLAYFLSDYFHQDWRESFATSEEVVNDFLNHEKITYVYELKLDIEIILNEKLNAEDLENQLIEFGSCFFSPELSSEQWLRQIWTQLDEWCQKNPLQA
jgi:CdiI immunity protein